MKPTSKSPEIETALKDLTGIDRVANIEADRCTRCHGPATGFRDALSEKEYTISGFCQKCQDETFGGGDVDTFDFDREQRLVELNQPAPQCYQPTENDYVIGRQPMISARGSAESRRYYRYLGKSGRTWLVADQPNAAANIYVEGGPDSRGFGGSTLTFPLVDGSEIKLKGPWHANSDSLFADTGVDVRDRHYTFVVISRRRESGPHLETICVDVLYKDNEPQLGSFHRGDELARQWAREINASVHLYSDSEGGSSSQFVKPDQTFYWEKDAGAATDLSSAQDAIVHS